MSTGSNGRSRAEGGPANKRRKVEPGEPADAPPPPAPDIGERSTDFWFDEGNVIVASRGKAFRVHTGILMLRSEVFKRLLNGPVLAQQPEQLEGCPIVRVQDGAREFHDLLHIIYNGGNSDWLKTKRPPIAYDDFRIVVPIAVKYEVQEIVEEARYRLSRIFPTSSLHNWDPSLCPDGDATALQLVHLDCIDALRLARLLDLPALIPLIFYAICNIADLAEVAAGVDYEDGAPRAVLAPDDLRTYLVGRQALMQESLRVLRALHELGAEKGARVAGCSSPKRCRPAFHALALTALDDELYCEPSPIDNMETWLANVARTTPEARPCKHCDEAVRKLINERREEAWRKLGTIFGVPEWPAG
ncbi:hypothetical protein PsYK624_060040 [Phanerochaete sordida]|uniref:BTB domain-containing protein n=1 Tax=Phanerochaete sordida TaxID=48140 RepID=A0A9P3LDG0_9APHY|nr:hypothetical protein PsYK624_060040 [Phanerochaete sordida]